MMTVTELNGKPWRVLIVEDDEDDYVLTRSMLLAAKGDQAELEWAPSFKAGRTALEDGHWDAVLVDYDLGEFTGLDFIQQMQSQGIRTPAILLTGRGSLTLDIDAMKAGAADYLSKSEASALLLERTIRYAIEHRQAQEALLEAKDELERRVQERTQELSHQNILLEAEIAKRQQMQRELAEVQRRLLDRAENQRIELAQELHDGPMQELYGITYQLVNIKGEAEDQQMQTDITDCQGKLEGVIHSLRTIAGELRPPVLAPFGLEKAIRSHTRQFAEVHPGLTIRLDLMPDGQALPERVRLALFRIYQMAMTNIIRHAQASQVDVHFKIDDDSALLRIQDNGHGFEVPQSWFKFAHQGHLGLAGAAERAEAMGGTLEVQSRPGEGTLLKVVLPLT
jgi:signal transduction histidine kinase